MRTPRKDRGSILTLTPLGEQGCIITWCTAERGLLRTAARDVRKPGSVFAGRVDLFHDCELLYVPAKQGDLHTLRSIELLHPRLELRRSLASLRLASHMARLIISTVEIEDSDPAWHTLIQGALDYLCTHAPSERILQHFEKRLATLHGLYSPAISPAAALLRHFKNLPPGRTELIAALTAGTH